MRNKWLKKVMNALLRLEWEFKLIRDKYNNYCITFILFDSQPIIITDDVPKLKETYKTLRKLWR